MASLHKSNGEEKTGHTAHGEAQRQALIRAAYDLIAEKGFEGLRTRDVAERAKVNIATLHYYFSTKEELIRGVVYYLREQFRFRHESPSPSSPEPLDYVRQEFADISYQIRTIPENFVVLFEILLRSLRDDTIRQIYVALDAEWLHAFEVHISDGMRHGIFRPDLDVKATAAAMIAFIQGLAFQLLFNPSIFPVERVYAQIERWLTDYVRVESSH
jgi:AcrR family transcriptional regulator